MEVCSISIYGPNEGIQTVWKLLKRDSTLQCVCLYQCLCKYTCTCVCVRLWLFLCTCVLQTRAGMINPKLQTNTSNSYRLLKSVIFGDYTMFLCALSNSLRSGTAYMKAKRHREKHHAAGAQHFHLCRLIRANQSRVLSQAPNTCYWQFSQVI